MSIEVKITVKCDNNSLQYNVRQEIHHANDYFKSGGNDLQAGRTYFNALVANAVLLKNGTQGK